MTHGSEETGVKHERVVEYLEGHGLDGVLLSRRCNFSWYTCGAHNYVGVACDVGNSSLLVTREGTTVFANNIEATRLWGEELADSGFDRTVCPYHEPGAYRELIRTTVGSRRVAADALLPGVELPPLPGDFGRLRSVLTPWEVERYRMLCDDTVAAVEGVARAAEPGLTEQELAGRLALELRRRDCVCWTLLVGADDRVLLHRHPLPTLARAERGFMLVAGAERRGLIASFTRLACFGPVPQELVGRAHACATVNAALVSSTRPGATLGDTFAQAQAAYAEVGFPEEWRHHHQGGSCGYLPRETKAAPGERTQALAGQAFASNPSIACTKCEDTILCTEAGPEPLARPTDWPVIEAGWRGHAVPAAGIVGL